MKYISLFSLILLCACTTTTQTQEPVVEENVIVTEEAIWEEQAFCPAEEDTCFVLFVSPNNKIYRCSSEDETCILAMTEAGFTRIGSETYSPLKDKPFLGFPKENWGKFVVWKLR